MIVALTLAFFTRPLHFLNRNEKSGIREDNVVIFQGSDNVPKYLVRPIAVTTDSKGNIYIIDRYAVNGFIKEFDSNGNYIKQFASLGQKSGQLETPTQLAVDNRDNLYVTDAGGVTGSVRKRKVQIYNQQGKFQKSLIVFPESAPQAGYYGPAGIAFSKDNIYLTNVDRVQQVGLNGKVIQEVGLKNQGIFGFFLSSNYIYGPNSVTVDNRGNIYVLDTYSGLVRVFNSRGQLTGQIEPRVVDVSEPLEGDIQIFNDSLYFVDSNLGTLTKLTLQGKKVWQVGSKGSGKNQFLNPTDIYLDSKGFIYVADSGNRCIKKLDSQGRFLKEIGKPPASVTYFSQPGEVEVDRKGNIYVADTGNNRVVKLEPQGKIKMIIRGEDSPRSAVGENSGKLFYPSGLAVDNKDNLYVVDYDYSRKQKFNPNGHLLLAFGPAGDIAIDRGNNIYLGNGTYVVKLNSNLERVMESENAQQESLYNQGNLTVDKDGQIFMIDRVNSVIKKFSSSGKLLGSFAKVGSKKGELLYPNGIALGRDNNLYVADSGNHRIQVFNRNGKFIRVIGGFGSGKGEFNFPQGVAVDGTGNLYIADTDNSRVVKIVKGARR